MDGFLFLIAACAACVIGVVIVKTAQHRNRQQHHCQRRKQLLIQTLQEMEGNPCLAKPRHFSDRKFEMELRLMHLSEKAEVLIGVLNSAAEIGEKAIASGSGDPACLAQWQEARSAMEDAEEAYSDALNLYHEFLGSLPPPLRAKAAERGALVMAIRTA